MIFIACGFDHIVFEYGVVDRFECSVQLLLLNGRCTP